MPQKYQMPEYMKRQVISFIKGYECGKRIYKEAREEIEQRGRQSNITSVIINEVEYGEIMPKQQTTSDPTSDKAFALVQLETKVNSQVVKAIDFALTTIGHGWAESEKKALTTAIWQCCIDGRRFVFSEWEGKVHICRNAFYEHRRKFLWTIAKKLEMM